MGEDLVGPQRLELDVAGVGAAVDVELRAILPTEDGSFDTHGVDHVDGGGRGAIAMLGRNEVEGGEPVLDEL